MSGALHSSNWFRIAALRPRLGGHVQIHRHTYRGEVWYVVEDRAAGKYHRFNPAAYRIVSALDGRRSMQDIWDALALELREDSPSQDEIVQLLGQLNASDLIVTEASVDVAELFQRHQRQGRQKVLGRIANPLALRFPLWDPDRFLAAWCHALRGVPLWAWGLLWLAAVVPAAGQVPLHWRELTENFNERLLAAGNLWILAIAFVVLKGLHELGHGWAIKVRGGEVHEMGLMLLLLYPVPYVEASSASAFARKSERMHVGAAGMLVELWVAALCLLAWTVLRTRVPALAGLRHARCRQRHHGGVQCQPAAALRRLLHPGRLDRDSEPRQPRQCLVDLPVAPPRLRHHRRARAGGDARPSGAGSSPTPPLALAYRLFVTFSIAWFIGQQYFFVGVLLAAWAIGSGVVWPLGKGLFKLPPTRRSARAG